VGGAHSNPLEAAATLKQALLEHLEELTRMTRQQLKDWRYQKFRNMGMFTQIAV
jgi:acetyl-CoA carboxylase carboxyl transferase subunit alpha